MPLFPLNNIDLSDIRLIASDVDGTLTQNGKFSSDFISTLIDLQSARIKVLLVTGRSAGWVSALVNYLPVAGRSRKMVVYFCSQMELKICSLRFPIYLDIAFY
jgi:hydroxymethylpyrimidine pyrophosphatase-like HAD family hydrolase